MLCRAAFNAMHSDDVGSGNRYSEAAVSQLKEVYAKAKERQMLLETGLAAQCIAIYSHNANTQRNALVLPDLLNLDLRNESRGGRCRTTSRAAEDKENVNPNSLRLQKQRRLAKARAAKKAAVPSAPEAATAPTAELSAPAASSAPAPKVEPRALHASHNALKRELSSIVSPPLAEIQGRHTRFMSRTSAGRTGSSLRDGYVCGDEMMMMSDSSPSGPVIR